MIFRQLFEPESSTYTYLIGDVASGRALLLDPVLETVERDLALLGELGLELAYTLETHVHADHLTGARKLRDLTGCQVAGPAMDGLDCVDVGVGEDAPLVLGHLTLQPLHTPGHTATHHCYFLERNGIGRVFTGDTLLIDGCGRTDFQAGDADALYHSVRDKLFRLPEDTLVYPGHDYQGRRVSTIAQERARNPRLRDGIDLPTFRGIMANLDLPYPKKMDYAVPGNLECGRCPDHLVQQMRSLCEVSVQGTPT